MQGHPIAPNAHAPASLWSGFAPTATDPSSASPAAVASDVPPSGANVASVAMSLMDTHRPGCPGDDAMQTWPPGQTARAGSGEQL
jgi:hypothetical protein